MDDEIKEKLFSILEEEKFDSEIDSSTSSNDESDEEFINVTQISDFDIDNKCNCSRTFYFCDSRIVQVISENSLETLLATIEFISDPEAKKSYLLELQQIISRQKEPKPQVTPFSMKQIMQRFDN